MTVDNFEEDENEVDDLSTKERAIIPIKESNNSTKLQRRRKIEDLFEEKRLEEEIAEFG